MVWIWYLHYFFTYSNRGNPVKVQDGRCHVEMGVAQLENGRGRSGSNNGQDEGSSTESQSHMKVTSTTPTSHVH